MRVQMRVLSIETASPPGSIALADDRKILFFERLVDARRTTETFAAVIREAIESVGWHPTDVELVTTSLGPGSFTGLRIGVTAAKVFAYATGARAIGVNTLELIASQSPTDGLIEAVLDAQRGELFAARYEKVGDELSEIVPTGIIHADSWIAERTEDAQLIGPGLKRIQSRLPANARLVPEDCWVPRADVLAGIALNRMAANDIDVSSSDSAFSLVPQYFRKSAAEEKADRKTG